MIREMWTRYKDWQTPNHVEKASRRERVKRQIWLIASTMLSVGAALSINVVIVETVGLGPNGILAIPLFMLVFGAFFVDAYFVFPWGVEYWDLTVPWQFREAEAKEK